jgi:hypothetical protein
VTKSISTKSLLVAFALVAVLSVAGTTVAKAKNNDDNTRPGWGYGDQNHEHTGPPGQSTRPDKDQDHDD